MVREWTSGLSVSGFCSSLWLEGRVQGGGHQGVCLKYVKYVLHPSIAGIMVKPQILLHKDSKVQNRLELDLEH